MSKSVAPFVKSSASLWEQNETLSFSYTSSAMKQNMPQKKNT